MMRLNEPEKDYVATLDQCMRGIVRDVNFLSRLTAAKPKLLKLGENYISAGEAGNLFLIPPVNSPDDDPAVVEAVKKSELVNLYEYYFRNEEKEARKIYDQLLNSAHEQCPFCGGIGTPRNLDHFLPKAHFPQFSVFPKNLIPSCRDCNMDGKAQAFAKTSSAQIIQPYIDHERFFNSQWIFAEYNEISPGMTGTIRYFVNPPADWDQIHKERVFQHFSDFNLAKRYAVKAAQLLDTTLAQISVLRAQGASSAAICDAILIPGIDRAPFVNHWQKGMFQALHHVVNG